MAAKRRRKNPYGYIVAGRTQPHAFSMTKGLPYRTREEARTAAEKLRRKWLDSKMDVAFDVHVTSARGKRRRNPLCQRPFNPRRRRYNAGGEGRRAAWGEMLRKDYCEGRISLSEAARREQQVAGVGRNSSRWNPIYKKMRGTTVVRPQRRSKANPRRRNPWTVVIGGSPQARQRWPKRTYKTKQSAKRYAKKVHEARDSGVSTIWTMKENPRRARNATTPEDTQIGKRFSELERMKAAGLGGTPAYMKKLYELREKTQARMGGFRTASLRKNPRRRARNSFHRTAKEAKSQARIDANLDGIEYVVFSTGPGFWHAERKENYWPLPKGSVVFKPKRKRYRNPELLIVHNPRRSRRRIRYSRPNPELIVLRNAMRRRAKGTTMRRKTSKRRSRRNPRSLRSKYKIWDKGTLVPAYTRKPKHLHVQPLLARTAEERKRKLKWYLPAGENRKRNPRSPRLSTRDKALIRRMRASARRPIRYNKRANLRRGKSAVVRRRRFRR